MIDLHVHILPGLDDGAKDLDESLEMCRVAVRDGITTIVATPHTADGNYDNSRDRVLAAVGELTDCLPSQGIRLTILPGADIHVHEQLDALINNRETLTVNDTMRYVMVEFPRHVIPPNCIEWMFRLILAGFTPILTHPERNTAIHRKTEFVREWVEKGGLVQLTAMSLTGEFDQEAKKCSEELLKHNLVHVIASDAHSAVRRPPVLSKAVECAASLVGPDYARKLVEDYPAAIIAGKTFDIPEPIPQKRSFFFNVFHRS
jgi:protein-tyrosine phosphatase